jgi:hypothetical protein
VTFPFTSVKTRTYRPGPTDDLAEEFFLSAEPCNQSRCNREWHFGADSYETSLDFRRSTWHYPNDIVLLLSIIFTKSHPLHPSSFFLSVVKAKVLCSFHTAHMCTRTSLWNYPWTGHRNKCWRVQWPVLLRISCCILTGTSFVLHWNRRVIILCSANAVFVFTLQHETNFLTHRNKSRKF